MTLLGYSSCYRSRGAGVVTVSLWLTLCNSHSNTMCQRFYAGESAGGGEDPWYVFDWLYIKTQLTRRLVMNDCAKAYKNFFCYANFPRYAAKRESFNVRYRCDEEGNSLNLCRSVCVSLFVTSFLVACVVRKTISICVAITWIWWDVDHQLTKTVRNFSS